ncbi:tripartite tricarboxylate transporter substrate binding protein [Bordetella sp. BOR01]|nr:tripartite tricarboxylate transporter substrate binding protein [Bordetella sp. BOR01]
MRRVGFLSIFLGVLAIAVLPGAATAEQSTWPSKPITLVVPFAAGGTTDIAARMIARYLGPALNTQVIVENRAGANGIVGSQAAARAAADGYTLVIVAPGHASNVSLYKELPYDTVNDFEPIMLLLTQPSILVVHPSVPANSVGELVALAKSAPGVLTYASGGTGSSQHLAAAMFASMAGLDLVHVPYKGSAPAEVDLLGGQVNMMFASMVSVLPQVKQGRLRALAVSSERRSPTTPDLPTVSESGVPGYAAVAWAGLLAPKGTPGPIVERLNAQITRIMDLPEVKKRMQDLGAEFSPNSPRDFDAFICSEITRWHEVVRQAKIEQN